MNKTTLRSLTLMLAAASAPALADGPYQDHEIQREPGAGAMFIDAVAVRPVMIATTLVGSAVFLISLPFSALGGNTGGAAENLVVEPAKSAFVRPLGQFD